VITSAKSSSPGARNPLSFFNLRPQPRSHLFQTTQLNSTISLKTSRYDGNRSSSPRLFHRAFFRCRRRILRPLEIRTQEYVHLCIPLLPSLRLGNSLTKPSIHLVHIPLPPRNAHQPVRPLNLRVRPNLPHCPEPLLPPSSGANFRFNHHTAESHKESN
jgi:hypothetical protein